MKEEQKLQIIDNNVKDLNFGLVEVVYEWARDKVKYINVFMHLNLKYIFLAICGNNETNRYTRRNYCTMHTTIK